LLHDRRGAGRALGGRPDSKPDGVKGRAASMAPATLADGAAGFMRLRGDSHSGCDRAGCGRSRPI
jgi:hypothetical protein